MFHRFFIVSARVIALLAMIISLTGIASAKNNQHRIEAGPSIKMRIISISPRAGAGGSIHEIKDENGNRTDWKLWFKMVYLDGPYKGTYVLPGEDVRLGHTMGLAEDLIGKKIADDTQLQDEFNKFMATTAKQASPKPEPKPAQTEPEQPKIMPISMAILLTDAKKIIHLGDTAEVEVIVSNQCAECEITITDKTRQKLQPPYKYNWKPGGTGWQNISAAINYKGQVLSAQLALNVLPIPQPPINKKNNAPQAVQAGMATDWISLAIPFSLILIMFFWFPGFVHKRIHKQFMESILQQKTLGITPTSQKTLPKHKVG